MLLAGGQFHDRYGDTLSAATALAGKAFQNGVELDAAMIIDAEVYDQEMSLRAVRPGTSIDVQFAYVLTSDTALVELELSSLRGDTSEVVSTTFDAGTSSSGAGADGSSVSTGGFTGSM